MEPISSPNSPLEFSQSITFSQEVDSFTSTNQIQKLKSLAIQLFNDYNKISHGEIAKNDDPLNRLNNELQNLDLTDQKVVELVHKSLLIFKKQIHHSADLKSFEPTVRNLENQFLSNWCQTLSFTSENWQKDLISINYLVNETTSEETLTPLRKKIQEFIQSQERSPREITSIFKAAEKIFHPTDSSFKTLAADGELFLPSYYKDILVMCSGICKNMLDSQTAFKKTEQLDLTGLGISKANFLSTLADLTGESIEGHDPFVHENTLDNIQTANSLSLGALLYDYSYNTQIHLSELNPEKWTLIMEVANDIPELYNLCTGIVYQCIHHSRDKAVINNAALQNELIKFYPKLTSLDLRNCNNLTDAVIVKIAKNCPKLTYLDLAQDKNWLSRSSNITDASIIELAENCPNLTFLDLTSCSKLTDASIIKLAENCPKLITLNLARGHSFLGKGNKFTDAAIIKVAENCPDLAVLDLGECYSITDAPLIKLAENCRKLTSLNLHECHHFTDTSIIKLAENCPDLTFLDLGESYSHITDEAIIKLAKNCRKLTSLNLQGCKNLTHVAIIELAENCPDLTSLDLSNCYHLNLTDAVIIKLVENCPKLTFLNLSKRCSNLTDAAIIKLTENCPDINSLDLTWYSNLTDAAVIKLAENCPNLTYLKLSGCRNLTDAAVIKLTENCPNLTTLYLSECENISFSIRWKWAATQK